VATGLLHQYIILYVIFSILKNLPEILITNLDITFREFQLTHTLSGNSPRDFIFFPAKREEQQVQQLDLTTNRKTQTINCVYFFYSKNFLRGFFTV